MQRISTRSRIIANTPASACCEAVKQTWCLLSLQDKNAALKAAGAIVPESFEGFEGIIKTTYDQLVEEGQIQPQPESEVRAVPQDLEAAKKAGKVRKEKKSLRFSAIITGAS